MGPVSVFGELPLIMAEPAPMFTVILIAISLALRNPWLCALSCIIIPLILVWELIGSAVNDDYFMGLEGGCRGSHEVFWLIFVFAFCACATVAIRPLWCKLNP